MSTAAFNAAMILDRFARAAPPCLYILGCSVLALKLGGAAERISAGMAAACFAAGCTVLVAVSLFRQGGWYSSGYARAWLDLHNRAGGAILSGSQPAEKRLAVRPGLSAVYAARSLVLPGAFLAAAFAVPAPQRAPAVSGAGVERAAIMAENAAAQAADSGLVSEQDGEELLRQARRLREMAAADPEAAAEAMNSLSQGMDAAQARRLEAFTDAVSRTAAALAALNAAGDDADAAAAAGDADLLEAYERLAGAGGLPPELEGAGAGTGGLPGGEVSREALESALQSLTEAGSGLSSAHEAAGTAGSGMPQLSSLNEALENARQELAAGGGFGAGGAGDPGDADAETGEGPGSGGVGQGPGEAPLVLGAESPDAGLRFEPRRLPPGEPGLPDQLLRRERRALPESMPPEEFRPVWRTAADAPESIYAGEGGAVLGPERARAAERYFQRLGETR